MISIESVAGMLVQSVLKQLLVVVLLLWLLCLFVHRDVLESFTARPSAVHHTTTTTYSVDYAEWQ